MVTNDLISRQAAIETALTYLVEYCGAAFDEDMQRMLKDQLDSLPSAQPFEIQEILDYLDTKLHPIISPEHWNIYSELHDMISTLPSAQPEKEIPKRVLWSGWKGMRDTRYKCPNCKKPVRNTDICCHRCGQKLMFPNIDFTPYVKGQKQELIVRWGDEE